MSLAAVRATGRLTGMPVRDAWEGNEWEAHCCSLLSIKYAEDIQFVPARVQGDGGLEAFRLDDGIVYQCYAPQDAYTNKDVTAAQKRKITKDLGTLVKNPVQTQELLGAEYRIRRWVLLTPEFDDKEVLKHARKEEKKLLAMTPGAPWLAGGFRILVSTDLQLFPAELATMHRPTASTIRIPVIQPTPEQVTEAMPADLVERLSRKLCVNAFLAANPEELEAYRAEVLMDYVYGKRQLSALEERYGSVYELVQRRAKATFNSLNRAVAAGDGGPSGLLAIEQDLAQGLARDLPALPELTCGDLARHFMSDWLISCPARFRAAS